MTPRVTVLMAVHNGEPYVRESLQSVLDQTFSDFELLVVDDASTDATVEIVTGLADDRSESFATTAISARCRR